MWQGQKARAHRGGRQIQRGGQRRASRDDVTTWPVGRTERGHGMMGRIPRENDGK